MKDHSECYCDEGPIFEEDNEFEDGEGFVCAMCQSNVFYL